MPDIPPAGRRLIVTLFVAATVAIGAAAGAWIGCPAPPPNDIAGHWCNDFGGSGTPVTGLLPSATSITVASSIHLNDGDKRDSGACRIATQDGSVSWRMKLLGHAAAQRWEADVARRLRLPRASGPRLPLDADTGSGPPPGSAVLWPDDAAGHYACHNGTGQAHDFGFEVELSGAAQGAGARHRAALVAVVQSVTDVLQDQACDS